MRRPLIRKPLLLVIVLMIIFRGIECGGSFDLSSDHLTLLFLQSSLHLSGYLRLFLIVIKNRGTILPALKALRQ